MFQVLNESDATHEGQAELDAVDFDELVAGLAGTGVVSGGAVSQDSGGASQAVDYTTVTYQINGTTYTKAAGSVTCSDATGFTTGYEAYDLIVANTSGQVVLKAGTPALPGEAVFPALDADTVLLAAIHRTEGDNTIVDADIVDKAVPRYLEGDATGDLYLDANTLYGGRADGETLDLQGNAADFADAIRTRSPIRALPQDPTWTAATNVDGFLLGWTAARSITMDYAGWGLSGVNAQGTVYWNQAAATFGGVQFFSSLVKHRNEDGTTVNGALNGITDLYLEPTITAVNAPFTIGTVLGIQHSPKVSESGTGTASVTGVSGVTLLLTLNNASAVSERVGFRFNNTVLNGTSTLAKQCGVMVADLSGATDNTALLIGTATIPTGTWAIHSVSSAESLLTGPLRVGSATGPTLQSGSGTPEGAVTAPVGSVYLRTDGGASTTLYVKESGTGNTGWVAK